MADIIELILADHLQIMGWAARLGDLSRRDRGRDDRAELAATRETLAALIDLHMRADDEICGPAVFGGDPDGRAMTRQTRDEVREIIRETSLQPPGTLRWWHLARTALSAWPIPASARLACTCRACSRTLEWALFRQRKHVRERPKPAGAGR